MSVYQHLLKNLLEDCDKYRNHFIGTEELRNSVWQTSRAVTNTEERELRDFLRQAEGQLDMAEFTCEDVFRGSLEIVSEIESKIISVMSNSSVTAADNKEQMSVKLDRGEVRLWTEGDSDFFIKTVTESDDFVRLSGEDARNLAEALVTMADKADAVRRESRTQIS